MPRDGLSQYAPPPGTNGVTNYTIESTKYNGFVADVTQDLNLPRPIVAGGTGANNAHDAMIALSGEIALQAVTNYDTFPFVSGSFYSNAGATSEPVAGHNFTGICYVNGNPAYVVVQARDTSIDPGAVYVRQKTAGVWGAWTRQAGSSADLDAAYVNVAGDSMTGPLTLNADPTVPLHAATKQYVDANAITQAAADARYVNVTGDGMTGQLSIAMATYNPLLRFTDTTAPGYTRSFGMWPSGTLGIVNNAGSALTHSFYDNGSFDAAGNITAVAGAYYFVNASHYLTYSSGANVFSLVGGHLFVSSGHITAASPVNGNVGTYYFGNSGSGTGGTKYLTYDGTNFSFSGGHLLTLGTSGVYSAGDVTAGNANAATGTFRFGNAGTRFLTCDGTNFIFAGGGVIVNGSTTSIRPVGANVTNTQGSFNVSYLGNAAQHGMIMRTTADGGVYTIGFEAANSANVGAITTTASATAYNTSSDMRLKEDLKSFDAGNIVDQTNVYDFAWKDTSARSYGIIAQQAAEVYPQAVTHVETEDWWGIDYSKYVPVILQELKALRARVAELEGKTVIEGKPS